MPRDRIFTMQEARSDYQPPVRRATPHERAQVLAEDPPWLHAGVTMRLSHRGTQEDFFGIGVLAAGIHRSPGTVRRLITTGVLPDARYRTVGRGQFGTKRLWRREEILALAEVFHELGLESRPRRWAGSQLPERVRHERH